MTKVRDARHRVNESRVLIRILSPATMVYDRSVIKSVLLVMCDHSNKTCKCVSTRQIHCRNLK